MITGTIHTKALFTTLDDAAAELLRLITSSNEQAMNTVPFKDSWTAAQVAAHVTKSNNSIVQALNMESKPANRDAGERVQELREMFLDFTKKFKAPEFILPSKDFYAKEALAAGVKRSFERLREEGGKVNLSGAINHPAFGDVTKFELLHFVIFHTQRHIRQFKNIMGPAAIR